MSRGSALENAISAACVHYERAGRASIRKQHTQRVGPNGIWASKSPIDFRGVIAPLGNAIAIEAKECKAASFSLCEDHFAAKQRTALDRQLALGCTTYLVVDMIRHEETYRVPWLQVQTFLAAPWRNSLSLYWLRAYGSLCREDGRGTPRRHCWVLDVELHPLQAVSMLAVKAEREKSPVISLDEPDYDPVTKSAEKLTKEERIERVRRATEAGIARQMRQRRFGR